MTSILICRLSLKTIHIKIKIQFLWPGCLQVAILTDSIIIHGHFEHFEMHSQSHGDHSTSLLFPYTIWIMHWKCYYKYKQTQIYWDTGFVWLSVIANMYNLLINKISCSHVSYKRKQVSWIMKTGTLCVQLTMVSTNRNSYYLT